MAQDETAFRWLHLSDLHFVSTPPYENMQCKLLDKLKEVITLSSPVDCIVITGDFFNKGVYDEKVTAFLKELYQLCSESGDWHWKEGDFMDRLFVCPGNHDLERNAGCYKANKANRKEKEYLYRPKVIKNLAREDSAKDIFGGHGKENSLYSLLTEKTFLQYEEIILHLLPPGRLGKYKHECIVYTGPKLSTPNPVVFIGINTELYAGQVRESKEILNDIASIHKEILEHEANQDFEDAKRAYERYVQLSEQVRDGNFADDDKKLCFISEDAQKYVKDLISGITDPIVIMFGHRSLSALTDGARIAEANFAKNFCFHSKIYLCGHSHKLGYKTIETALVGDAPYDQYQTCVGGVFADFSEYDDFSFSIGEISWRNGAPTAYGTLYLWAKRQIDDSYDWTQYSPPSVAVLTSSVSLHQTSGEEDMQINREAKQPITENLQLKKPYSDDVQVKDSDKTIQDLKEKRTGPEEDPGLRTPHIPKLPF